MPQKEKIQQMFDSIAPEYDAFNHLTSLGIDRLWRRRALKFVAPAGEGMVRVLDVACGTGDFSIAIARELRRRYRTDSGVQKGVVSHTEEGKTDSGVQKGGISHTEEGNTAAGGRKGAVLPPEEDNTAAGGQNGAILPPEESSDWLVVGSDISEGMMEVMREKVRKAGLEPEAVIQRETGMIEKSVLRNGVIAETGDATAMRYPDGTFDTVTVAFGVRNFEDREAGLREIRRVLKPGGHFVMLELGVPAWKPARWVYNLYFTRIMPRIGRKLSGNGEAYRYLPASVLGFPGKKEWIATMERCGLRNCRHRALTFGICRLYTAQK